MTSRDSISVRAVPAKLVELTGFQDNARIVDLSHLSAGLSGPGEEHFHWTNPRFARVLESRESTSLAGTARTDIGISEVIRCLAKLNHWLMATLSNILFASN